jgi:hypothetical protein
MEQQLQYDIHILCKPMKNKKLAYILLPAVILIWGAIFYRIFNAANGDEKSIAAEGPHKGAASERSYTDTFSIIANYRDPFLGKLLSVTSDHPKPAIKQQKAPDPKPQPVALAWPALAYSGMIKNQRSSMQLAILHVNGQSHNVKTGETIDGVQVVRIFKDSVEVAFQKEKRIIRK